MDLPHSLQTRLALGYFCIIAALLVLMNTYPMIMNQNLLFRSKQTTMANQAALVTNTLVTADELTSETVTQAIAQLEDLEVQRRPAQLPVRRAASIKTRRAAWCSTTPGRILP